NLVRIPDVVVDAVVYWPFAAWPKSSPGMYDLDEAHMKLMNEALATDDGTAAYYPRLCRELSRHRRLSRTDRARPLHCAASDNDRIPARPVP
ncbi:MAG: hypothetical protein ACXW3V_08915, partial [Methylocystis sp.]